MSDNCHICGEPKAGTGKPLCSYPHGRLPVEPIEPGRPNGFWEWMKPKMSDQPQPTIKDEPQHVGEDIRPTPRSTLVFSSLDDTQERSGAGNEALAYTRASFGQLTAREEQLALAAARVAYLWALREMLGELNAKVKNAR